MSLYRTLLIAITLSAITLIFFRLHKSEKHPEPAPINSDIDAQTNTDPVTTLGPSAFDIDERTMLSDGKQDIQNRYAHTVTTEAVTPAGDSIRCSGVLITPSVVLTAGHCVCINHKPSSSEHGIDLIIDSSQCISTVSVTTALYNLRSPSSESHESTQKKTYTGKTKPHPNLRILLTKQGTATSSTADLALIFLETPVPEEIPPVPIASRNIQSDDLVTLVGYGYDATSDIIYGIRRFGTKKVTKFSPPETVLFEQQGSEGFTSGSGEPCLYKTGKNTFIVGITGRDIGEAPTFTSTHIYYEWVNTELRKSNTDKSHLPPQ